MARSDPLMPNAGIVARREYRDRTRSPLFLGSTVLLAILAMMVAVAPIGIRYMDRQTVTRIGVVSADTDLGERSVAIADQLLNVPPGGATDPAWERPYAVEVIPGQDQALVMLHSGDLGGFLVVNRLPSGQVDIQYRTLEGPNSARSQIAAALLNEMCGDYFDAQSAGLEPGVLNHLAVEALQERGIDISRNKTQSVFDVWKSGQHISPM